MNHEQEKQFNHVWVKLTVKARIQDGIGRVLFVRPHYRNDFILPGGDLEHGEHAKECLQRECLEELGVNVQLGDPVGTIINMQNHPNPCALLLYDCFLENHDADNIIISNEIQEYKWVDLRQGKHDDIHAMDAAVVQTDDPEYERIIFLK